ncbi:MAG: tetratricopeptide repeat protein [Alphaproteobacteria bacterium]
MLVELVFSLLLLVFYAQFKGDKIIGPKDLIAARVKADQGDAEGQAFLANSYLFGTGGQKLDLAEGYRLARLAAEQNNGHAYYLLANIYLMKEHCSQGAEFARKSAAQDNTHGLVFYGAMLTRGWCVQQDEAEAVKMWSRAATQENKGEFLHDVGIINAQHNLAISYWWGEGVPQNRIEGLKWCVKSALNGGPGAARLLTVVLIPCLLVMFATAYVAGFFEKRRRKKQ